MKILVPIKRVVDYNVKVRPKADESDVDGQKLLWDAQLKTLAERVGG